MPIEHLALPYSCAALEPHLSAATVDAHHGVCHRSEVERLNARIEGSEFAELMLEEIIAQAQGTLFQLAAQVWNHNFYWQCLRPRGGGEPLGRLADSIAASFGDFVHFKQEFNRIAPCACAMISSSISSARWGRAGCGWCSARMADWPWWPLRMPPRR